MVHKSDLNVIYEHLSSLFSFLTKFHPCSLLLVSVAAIFFINIVKHYKFIHMPVRKRDILFIQLVATVKFNYMYLYSIKL